MGPTNLISYRRISISANIRNKKKSYKLKGSKFCIHFKQITVTLGSIITGCNCCTTESLGWKIEQVILELKKRTINISVAVLLTRGHLQKF